MNKKAKLKLDNLKVSSFITKAGLDSTRGGATFATCGPITCAAACSWTNGNVVCKEV